MKRFLVRKEDAKYCTGSATNETHYGTEI